MRNRILPCGCEKSVGDKIGPVMWNKFNQVIQCHMCGTVYIPAASGQLQEWATKAIYETIGMVSMLNEGGREFDAIKAMQLAERIIQLSKLLN